MIAQVKSKGDKVNDCMLTHNRTHHLVQTVVIPSATYAFPLADLTPTDLAKLDRLYASICKKALGVPISTPTPMIYDNKEKAAAGMASLTKDYVKAISESLVYSLLDKGQLGVVSRTILHLQNNILGNVLRDKTANVGLRQPHSTIWRESSAACNRQTSNLVCQPTWTTLKATCYASRSRQ